MYVVGSWPGKLWLQPLTPTTCDTNPSPRSVCSITAAKHAFSTFDGFVVGIRVLMAEEDDAIEAPARLRLADPTAVCRGFHGVWEASNLVECVCMIKSGSVTRLRVLEECSPLDLAGANAICTGLCSPECRIETLWLRSLSIPSDAGKELALTNKCST